jgi:hypothetical protein
MTKFWSSLRKLLGTKLKMSSAFHPETDGQSERAFGVFQEMVRPLVDKHVKRSFHFILDRHSSRSR